MDEAPNSSPETVTAELLALFPDQDGFELHQFKVGSYNMLAGACFQLPYEEDVLGVLLLNTPSFFETVFKNWLQKKKKSDESLEEFAQHFPDGPIHAYFEEKFQQVRKKFGESEVITIHDGELFPSRRPKILMTTCGHVAGATFFYHPPEEALGIAATTLLSKKRRTGLGLHPKYGGYFAYRGVFIFPHIRLDATFKEKRAPMLLDTVEKQEEAIQLFNHHWWDGKYRDCGNPIEKYSDLQLKYFNTLPEKRWAIIAHWFE